MCLNYFQIHRNTLTSNWCTFCLLQDWQVLHVSVSHESSIRVFHMNIPYEYMSIPHEYSIWVFHINIPCGYSTWIFHQFYPKQVKFNPHLLSPSAKLYYLTRNHEEKANFHCFNILHLLKAMKICPHFLSSISIQTALRSSHEGTEMWAQVNEHHINFSIPVTHWKYL